MGDRMEVKRERGRPKKEHVKVHLPNVVIYEQTLEELQDLADRSDVSLSALLQEAVDLYLLRERRKSNLIY